MPRFGVAVASLCLLLPAAVSLRGACLDGPAPPGSARTGTLTVLISGVKPDRGGELVLSLFDAEQAWLKPDRARGQVRVGVQGTAAQGVFREIPPGTYALEVFHDANRNGRLDRRGGPVPLPTEGSGTSNNQRRMGPPLWDAARFEMDGEGMTVRIELRYY